LPALWAKLLPWIALLSATVFLLAVVYWTSSTRGIQPATDGTPAGGTAVAEQVTEGDEGAVTPVTITQTPELQMPAPPGDYLTAVIPLPEWARVNVNEEPLIVRQEPSTTLPYIGVLNKGQSVRVTGFSSDGEWSQIDSPILGWVHNDYLLFYLQDAPLTAVRLDVQARRTQSHPVDVRATPDVSAAVSETLPPSTQVVVATVMGEPATWYQIAEPVIGWVAATDLAPLSP
jgi:hypothetical protein